MAVRSLNRVMLIGNVTRDPNTRFTPNGTSVSTFGLATNRSWTPSDGGEKQERAEFHTIVAWGKLAEICGNLLHKGDKVYVEGRLQTREWKTDEGQQRRVTEVVIEDMMLLNSRGNSSYSNSSEDSDDEPTTRKSKSKSEDNQTVSDTSTDDVEDISDDIPF